jgi:hypothetical protein
MRGIDRNLMPNSRDADEKMKIKKARFKSRLFKFGSSDWERLCH